jgi:hypothetical protein
MEGLNSILQTIGNGIRQFVEFSQRDFDAFFAIFMFIIVIVVLVSVLILANEVYKWIKGDKDGIGER